MVSLENRSNYLSKISGSPKLSAFNSLLKNNVTIPFHEDDGGKPDEIYYGMISAIQSNDKVAFEKYYSRKSKSNPNKDSPAPFVNDDFLIFIIILGVFKFSIEEKWIKYIVSIRSKNSITTTLDNLLAKNYYSTSNLPEIVLMFLKFEYQNLITNDFLNFTYLRINENLSLFESKSDFQILCAVHSYDYIILLKEAPKGSEIEQLITFNSRFIKRTKILTWLLEACLMFAIIWGMLKLPVFSPRTVELINKYGYIFNLLGALGFTLIGNRLKFISRKSHQFTMLLLGYTKSLIKDDVISSG